MARQIGKLKALNVARKKKPGMYADGGGLYLQVTAAGSRSWIFRYALLGKTRYMGLGPLHAVGLADARKKAAAARQLRHDGIDPIDARNADIVRARLEAAKSISFREAAERHIEAHEAGWRNAKHASQWRSTLETYAHPIFGDLPVQAVDVALVMKVLEPIWAKKTETASRVRGRIESILDWATARGYRLGDNPARWRGHLDNLLPRRSRVQRVSHHAALPYDEIAAFMESLRVQDGITAQALDFLILSAGRTGEVVGARRGEFNLNDAVWTVPAERVKSGREHRVPVSAPAMEIVRAMDIGRASESDSDFVFPGGKRGKSLSTGAFLALLRRMDREDITPHGFRSTFRDWAAERTNYPREVAEMALGHVISDKVEAAYRRGDLFEKRRRLMDEWSRFCGTEAKAGKVVAIGGRKK
ncbi:MAG: integrase arm-type DNA-binding domain-containing protein [Rhodospirillales bacterium]|jgi:integrase|nr:integrase arm-type DNA-binding domain-containing protein [Rhodospirillales bacterium]